MMSFATGLLGHARLSIKRGSQKSLLCRDEVAQQYWLLAFQVPSSPSSRAVLKVAPVLALNSGLCQPQVPPLGSLGATRPIDCLE